MVVFCWFQLVSIVMRDVDFFIWLRLLMPVLLVQYGAVKGRRNINSLNLPVAVPKKQLSCHLINSKYTSIVPASSISQRTTVVHHFLKKRKRHNAFLKAIPPPLFLTHICSRHPQRLRRPSRLLLLRPHRPFHKPGHPAEHGIRLPLLGRQPAKGMVLLQLRQITTHPLGRLQQCLHH